MSQEIDYDLVLADLEARKAALEAAIATIKQQVRGQPIGDTPTGMRGQVPDTSRESTIVEAGMFHGLSFVEAAKKFLGMVKKKQSTKAICDALLTGGIETTAKNFYSNVYSVLQRDKAFIKLGTFWGLREWYPTRALKGVTKARTRKKATKRPANTKPSGPKLLKSGDEQALMAKGSGA